MSAATAVLDTERLVAELRKDGVPEVKAYAIARLLADVQQPEFDREIACVDLVRAGFSPEETDQLIEEALAGSTEEQPP
jgi:hypothetical protein